MFDGHNDMNVHPSYSEKAVIYKVIMKYHIKYWNGRHSKNKARTLDSIKIDHSTPNITLKY